MKILITHEGQQSVFRRIAALNGEGINVSYATSFYHKNTYLNRVFKRMLPKSEQIRLEGRRCEFINDDNVYVFNKLTGMLFIIINRIDKSRKIRNRVLKKLSNRFAKNVINLIKKEKYDLVIVLGESADSIAELIYNERISIPVVKDTTSANWKYCDEIYRNDVQYSGVFGRDMQAIFLRDSNQNDMGHTSQHYFKVITSSNFVADSYKGEINKEDTCIVTYGMDVNQFTQKIDYLVSSEKLKVIYVGNVDERKGIYYLNELAKRCKDIASFTVVGDSSLSVEAIEELKKNTSVRGRIAHHCLPEEYKKHDIFLFPSLSDSFGNVVAEAMATGLTVICSRNAGVSDLIQNEKNGYIVDYNELDKMEKILRYLYVNPQKIAEIGSCARKTAVDNNPKHYEQEYAKTVKNIMKSWLEIKSVKK